MTCIDCGGEHDLVEHYELNGHRRVRVVERSMCPEQLTSVLRMRACFEPGYGPGAWAKYLPHRFGAPEDEMSTTPVPIDPLALLRIDAEHDPAAGLRGDPGAHYGGKAPKSS